MEDDLLGLFEDVGTLAVLLPEQKDLDALPPKEDSLVVLLVGNEFLGSFEEEDPPIPTIHCR